MTDTELTELLTHPVESFNLEVKTWINPKTDKGLAKIVRACLALRNSNGGMLIIGMTDDKKLDEINRPNDFLTLFEQDYIQSLISKYASNPFEIVVRFATKDGKQLPTIIVPNGLKTPVAIKKELKIDGNNVLLRNNAIYVRTLASNNTVSTAEASATDWERLVSICFENRETDIGQFIRRHLTPENIGLLSKSLKATEIPSIENPTNLNLGYLKFEAALRRFNIGLPNKGFFEISSLIQGQVDKSFDADQNFLNLIASANRNVSGWPFWLDSRRFPERNSHPYVLDFGWEALIESHINGEKIDFWRISPTGNFYAIRSLDDDRGGERRPEPGTEFDPVLAIWRVAEVLLLTVAFAKAMTFHPENSHIFVGLRWTGMNNRELSDWASNDGRYYSSSNSIQESVESTFVMPIDVPDDAIYQYVEQGIQPVVNIFGGAKLSTATIEDVCKKIALQRFNN